MTNGTMMSLQAQNGSKENLNSIFSFQNAIDESKLHSLQLEAATARKLLVVNGGIHYVPKQ